MSHEETKSNAHNQRLLALVIGFGEGGSASGTLYQ